MPSVRVATFNISGGIPRDKRFYSKRGNAACRARVYEARSTLDEMASLLLREKIQIAGLQEVDTCYCGSDTLYQNQYLAQKLEAEVAYEPLFAYNLARITNVRTGLATLSHPQIVRRQRIPFPQARVPWQRKLKARLLGAKGALHTVHKVDGELLHIVNAHLTHDIDAQKEFELSFLLDYCSALDPVVLLADLNTTPLATRSSGMVERHYFGADKCMTILKSAYRKHAGIIHVDPRLEGFGERASDIQELCTYPAGKESIKLDYCIGFSRQPTFSLSRERVISSTLSNHSPCSVEVSW